jgi:hypothetical protein
MGGGSFDLLLDMVDEGQPPETTAMETAPRPPGLSPRLPVGYQLEHDPDVLSLRGPDGSVVAVFSARGTTAEAVARAVEEDRRGLPAYFGPEEYASSVRRLVETRVRHSWERFLRTERRALDARSGGQMARALACRLPGESQEELDRMTSEDRRRAKEGSVALRSEEGELSYKHVEELSPEDRMDRIRAELARIEWLLERQGRRNIILRSDSFGQPQSRKSRN